MRPWCETITGKRLENGFSANEYDEVQGVFAKFKARLVAGGDQQDHALSFATTTCLHSAPTARNESIVAIAAIAAAEGHNVITIDFGGAFLDKIMTRFILRLDPPYAKFVESEGKSVVSMDKAL